MDLIGVNIPAPKVRIAKSDVEKYVDLYRGIRDRTDTVTWRTLIITIRKLLGQEFPDFKKVPKRLHFKGRKLIRQLVARTYLERLVPEIEYAVGIRGLTGRGGEDLDFLLLSGRHFPEALLWNLADFASSKGKKVVILASTQTKLSGGVSVLSNVWRVTGL